MAEIRTDPVTATFVESISSEGVPAGAMKFFDGDGFSPRGFRFLCPCGCGATGNVRIGGDGALDWNGSRETPTVRQTIRLYAPNGPHWAGRLTNGIWESL